MYVTIGRFAFTVKCTHNTRAEMLEERETKSSKQRTTKGTVKRFYGRVFVLGKLPLNHSKHVDTNAWSWYVSKKMEMV